MRFEYVLLVFSVGLHVFLTFSFPYDHWFVFCKFSC